MAVCMTSCTDRSRPDDGITDSLPLKILDKGCCSCCSHTSPGVSSTTLSRWNLDSCLTLKLCDLQVYAWTVNTAAMLQAVQPAPVDAIVTDVPAEVSRLLRKSTMTDLSSGGDGYVEL